MPLSSPTILLFLKAPRPGFVKTRLAKDLGEDEACEVYRRLVELTLASIPDDFPVRIYYTPRDATQEIRELVGPDLPLHPQAEGDLGLRLKEACRETFADGASSLMLIGGDCAQIRRSHFVKAARLLNVDQPVVGPALDGGYWLLGLTQDLPSVFDDIDWSTSTVLEQTHERFAALKISLHGLELLEDVDDYSSYQRATALHPTTF